jgi:WD40 repeat protein
LSVAFSPDGQWLASGSYDHTVRVWAVVTGQEVRRLEGHGAAVWSVAFSPNGQWLASGSEDGTVRVWAAATGQEVRRLAGHGDYVRSVAFSPDGQWLASGSADRTVRVWEVANGQLRVTLAPLPEGWVAFTPDGRYQYGGEVRGNFWHVIGLCRFEVGELDPYFPWLREMDLGAKRA